MRISPAPRSSASWSSFHASRILATPGRADPEPAHNAYSMCILRRNSCCIRIPRGLPGNQMRLLPTALSLILWLSPLVLPVTSQRCQLVRAGQQPLNPSVPSPSISSITNTSSTPTSTSSTPQPTFVYGRDKVRGVNLCVIPDFSAFSSVRDFHIPPLEVAGSCSRYVHFPHQAFVTEGSLDGTQPWITPSIFENTGNDAIVDEYTFGQMQDRQNALRVLETHWQTWIVEDDFRQIKAAGLNHVRYV